mgnify:CR=1 FL=1
MTEKMEKIISGCLIYKVEKRLTSGLIEKTLRDMIKENIDETVFMFAFFKCRKSDKGRN